MTNTQIFEKVFYTIINIRNVLSIFAVDFEISYPIINWKILNFIIHIYIMSKGLAFDNISDIHYVNNHITLKET